MKAKILLIEATDFENYPTGGSGSFIKNMIYTFGSKVALVGLTTTKNQKVGFWTKKKIHGVEHDYFPVKYVKIKQNKKPLIPRRLTWYLSLKKYKKRIMRYECNNVFIQSPDTLIAIYSWGYKNICYRFAGLANPLSHSRYKFARLFQKIFEFYYIMKFKYVNTFIASASKEEILDYTIKLKKYGINIDIKWFPTLVNTKIFYPSKNKLELRLRLGFEKDCKLIVTTGRLSQVKGWRLLLDSFKYFLKIHPNSYILFIGNGEDKTNLKNYVYSLGISKKVKLLGFLEKKHISNYLNIADLFVMGSYIEGWPTSMIEAIACNVPICTTNFKSAYEIVNSHKIGVIVESRDPKDFANGMLKAMNIKCDYDFYMTEIEKYDAKLLETKLLDIWNIY